MSVKLTIDTTVSAAYVEITDEEVVETVQAGSGVMVDLDVENRPVGVEVLNVNVDLPLTELAERFDLSAEVVEALRQIRSSFPFGRYSQGADGTSVSRGIPALA